VQWTEKECNCNRGIINFRSIRFMINDSRIELRCRKFNRMAGWWHIFTNKIMSLSDHGLTKNVWR
jgi:hypothetical protein